MIALHCDSLWQFSLNYMFWCSISSMFPDGGDCKLEGGDDHTCLFYCSHRYWSIPCHEENLSVWLQSQISSLKRIEREIIIAEPVSLISKPLDKADIFLSSSQHLPGNCLSLWTWIFLPVWHLCMISFSLCSLGFHLLSICLSWPSTIQTLNLTD